MRPNNVIDAKVEGNLSGETVKMEIDATATAHLMSVLTDLYSDRIMAFIREYATNAWDAHIEAGISRPIEITLPSRMSSYYRVKDYGIGLDLDAIRDIYSKYGASTKRASDSFNGMLGLGCKSAMTYAAQFSIISVKDGVKYNVAVSRGADGVGEMEVMPSEKTNEPNGVEIVIPVKKDDVWAVAEKAQYFFQWWDEGTVTVNGAYPKRFVGRKVVDNLYMIDGLSQDLVVMGNVPYPVPYEGGIYAGNTNTYGYSQKNFGVVYFAEMGAVTFAPNRESLSTVANTKATVEKAKALFMENLKKSLQKEFDAITGHIEVLKHRRSLNARYRDIDFGDFTYKGEKIPTKDWEAPFKMVTPIPTAYQTLRNIIPAPYKHHEPFIWYDPDGGSSADELTELTLERVERYHQNMVFLVNGPKTLTAHQRTKIRRAKEAGDIDGSWVMIVPTSTPPGGVWTQSIKVQDWSVVRDFKMTTNGISDRTKHGVYEIDGTFNERAVPDAEKIVYVSPARFSGNNYYGPRWENFKAIVNKDGFTFARIGKNRHEKFAREHKNAVHLDEYMQSRVKEYEKNLSKNDKALLGFDDYDLSRLENLRASRVDITDPTLVDFIRGADKNAWSAATKIRNNMSTRASTFGITMEEITDVEPFANYPLVGCLNPDEVKSHAQHVANYINAVYGQQKKGI